MKPLKLFLLLIAVLLVIVSVRAACPWNEVEYENGTGFNGLAVTSLGFTSASYFRAGVPLFMHYTSGGYVLATDKMYYCDGPDWVYTCNFPTSGDWDCGTYLYGYSEVYDVYSPNDYGLGQVYQ